ncbi:potential fungal zinc cluster transcription factor [Pseudozyma hubeiensis SY62]|uniref:Potential fungal zinc cluster transcription factor n=1 Tax=Pseudozyma hubeiensis (strain SY62) TaxID=1305764 RepID=R9P6L3_PSEHS|nr:potential fungal zinc cluster transcription factor [Pseudozyma hubeiensis SY62]GAC93735.1 potential fungal zinc cluster transcription factor [Pseudozyma hubeiensis SY62]
MSGLKKKRIQQACRPCGIKRVKCDGSMPCVTCRRSGEVCEYGQPKKRGPPKGSTRGGSKAAKRKDQVQQTSFRKDAHDAATTLPVQSTRDYAAGLPSSADPSISAAPFSRPPLPPPTSREADWDRGPTAAPASSSAVGRYLPHSSAYATSYGALPPHASALSESYPYSSHNSPDSNHRSEAYRAGGSAHDGSVGSPNYGGINTYSNSYHPAHSHPSRYDPASASHGSAKHRAEPFYRGGSSGLGLIRPPPGTADRKLPPLDFQASHPSSRSSSSPNHYGRLSITSDTFESALSGRSAATRSVSKTSAPYARPSPTAAASFANSHAAAPALYDPANLPLDSSRYDHRSTHGSTIPTSQSIASSRQVDGDKSELSRPSGTRSQHAGESNQLLVEGALLQMQRDRLHDPAYKAGSADLSGPRYTSSEDVNLEPLLWVEPGDGSRNGVNRSGVSLNKPEIPPLIQERLFTIFWGIVETIWPALYKPALCLTGFDVIDPEKHPMLHNAACALAAVAWDSGDFGVSVEDTEATQSDWVERTVSDLSFSSGSAQLGDGTSLRRLNAADLGDIFLARAKYYLVKTNNEPSLETIQSLLFMALREGGNGRASQASAYISTACRMCVDLGLHRQRDFTSVLGLQFSHAEEQARRRIFWCLYLLDKTSSASLGRPVTLRYAEIDCPLPDVDEVDEHETWAETTNNSSLIKDHARSMLLKTPVAAMTHLKSGVRLGHICEQIIAIYTHVQRGAEDDDSGSVRTNDGETVPEWETRLVRLHTKLVAWERDLPYRLRFDVPSHRLPNTLSQHLWYQACKVMLHRPYILKQSSRPDLPPSHRICTDAVGSICDILTAYDNNFGMRKLSSTFTYCIFTASTIEIANTTSTDAVIALEAKRRLRKFMTWLSRMSGTWQSASHHLKILEQLGHGIDADLDGTGLPSHRGVSGPDGMTVSRADSPSATVATAKSAGADAGASTLSMPNVQDQQQQMAQSNGGDLVSNSGASGMTLPQSIPAMANDDLAGQSIPGPIGAPMYLTRPRVSYQIPAALQGDLQARFQASGQNPGLTYGWPTGSRLDSANDNSHVAAASGPMFEPSTAAAGAAQPISDRMTSVSDTAAANLTGGGQATPTAYLKLHDTSYWGAMPLSSEDPLSWANFTSSYIEALNGMTQPIASTAQISNTQRQ